MVEGAPTQPLARRHFSPLLEPVPWYEREEQLALKRPAKMPTIGVYIVSDPYTVEVTVPVSSS